MRQLADAVGRHAFAAFCVASCFAVWLVVLPIEPVIVPLDEYSPGPLRVTLPDVVALWPSEPVSEPVCEQVPPAQLVSPLCWTERPFGPTAVPLFENWPGGYMHADRFDITKRKLANGDGAMHARKERLPQAVVCPATGCTIETILDKSRQ